MALGKKTGGRIKGASENRIPKPIREAIANKATDYFNSQQFADDLGLLTSRERLSAMTALVGYVVAKLQATTVTMSESRRKTIEDTLKALSQEEGDTP